MRESVRACEGTFAESRPRIGTPLYSAPARGSFVGAVTSSISLIDHRQGIDDVMTTMRGSVIIRSTVKYCAGYGYLVLSCDMRRVGVWSMLEGSLNARCASSSVIDS